MLPDELLRLDNSQEIVLFRGHKPLQLYKITPEELPDFEKLRPVRLADSIPEWRRLEEEKAREMRERRTTQRESPPPLVPPRQEQRQPPKREERSQPVREPMQDRPSHPQREEIPAYAPMRLVREDSRPPLTHPVRSSAPPQRQAPPTPPRKEESPVESVPPQTPPQPETLPAPSEGLLLKKTGDEITVEELLGSP